jgi:hypothetical protein
MNLEDLEFSFSATEGWHTHRLVPYCIIVGHLDNKSICKGPSSVLRSMLEGSKVCWFIIVSLELVLSKLIVLSICSRLFPYGKIFYCVLAWLNCPPYVFDLMCRIHLKLSDKNRHSGHCPVVSPGSCDPSITTFDNVELEEIKTDGLVFDFTRRAKSRDPELTLATVNRNI